MQNHGVFTIGADARAAVKAAVMCEDVARTVHIARQLGAPLPIDQPDIDSLYDRYQNVYGQQTRRADDHDDDTSTPRPPEVWFLTGSQGLYGDETLDQVADAVAGGSRAGSTRPRTVPVRVVWKPVLLTPRAIRRQMLEANSDPQCVGVIAWMHTFSPAKMWIAGLDALRKPLLHLHTQAGDGAAVVDHRHGLHEPQPGRARRPRVRLHPDPARRRPQDRRRPRATRPSRRHRRRRWARAALGRPELRTLKLARFGDNMRDVAVTEGDKVEAQLRFGVSVNTYGVNDLVAVVDAGRATPTSTSSSRSTTTRYAVAPELRRGGERHESLRYGARIELGLRPFLDRGRLRCLHHQLRGPRRAAPAARPRRAAADGRRLRLRRRGRLEDVGAAARREGDGARDCPAARSFMEDYTYHLVPGEEKILGAHMLEVCPSHRGRARPSLEIHPLAIGGREDPVRLRFAAAPGPAVVVGLADLGDRFRLTVNEIDVVEPDEPLPNLPVACAVWEPRPSLSTSAESWLMAGAPAPHRAVEGGRRRGAARTSPR